MTQELRTTSSIFSDIISNLGGLLSNSQNRSPLDMIRDSMFGLMGSNLPFIRSIHHNIDLSRSHHKSRQLHPQNFNISSSNHVTEITLRNTGDVSRSYDFIFLLFTFITHIFMNNILFGRFLIAEFYALVNHRNASELYLILVHLISGFHRFNAPNEHLAERNFAVISLI